MYLNNTSLFTKDSNREPLLLAHRGLAQTFHMEGITGRIYEPKITQVVYGLIVLIL